MMPLLSTIEEEAQTSWSSMFHCYRLQFQAISSASAIFIAGGMKFAWSVFESPFSNSTITKTTHLLTIAWFVGVAAGALIASTFVQHASKNVAHYTSGILLLLGSILFICTPTTFFSLVCSCLMEGCAYGINQIQSLVTAGECVHKDIRGLLASSERIFLWLGICLQLFCTRIWFMMEPINGYMMQLHVNQLHGLVVIMIALVALILNFLYHYESPMMLLQMQQQDLTATYVIKRLYGAQYITSVNVTQTYKEYKRMLAYDFGQSSSSMLVIVCKGNGLSLFKVLLLRCYATIFMSLAINRTFITASMTGLNCNMNCIYLYALCGFMGSLFGALCVDKYGRCKITVISALFAGTCAFLVGGTLRYIYKMISYKLLTHLIFEFIVYLIFCCQFFISSGIFLTSTVYMTEAFTIIAKAKCLSLVVVVEQIMQIILTLIIFSYNDFYLPYFFLTIGIIGMIIGMFAHFFLPETIRLSLHESLLKFNTTL